MANNVLILANPLIIIITSKPRNASLVQKIVINAIQIQVSAKSVNKIIFYKIMNVFIKNAKI